MHERVRKFLWTSASVAVFTVYPAVLPVPWEAETAVSTALLPVRNAVCCAAEANSQASVAQYEDAHFKLTYPLAELPDRALQYEINHAIRAEIRRFVDAVCSDMKNGGTISAAIQYEIKRNDKDFLSFTLDEYTYAEGAAHGQTYRKGMTFRKRDGRLCTYADVLPPKSRSTISVESVEEKLLAAAKAGGYVLYPNFSGLTELPSEFYLDEQDRLHFLFQQYEVAPYAVGIIDVAL